jgi:hypothetical protein
MIAASQHVNVMLLQLKMSSWDDGDDDEEVTLTYLHCTCAAQKISQREFSSKLSASSGGGARRR